MTCMRLCLLCSFLIGSRWFPLFFSANQKPFVICTRVTGQLHSFLSQSILSTFFVYTIKKGKAVYEGTLLLRVGMITRPLENDEDFTWRFYLHHQTFLSPQFDSDKNLIDDSFNKLIGVCVVLLLWFRCQSQSFSSFPPLPCLQKCLRIIWDLNCMDKNLPKQLALTTFQVSFWLILRTLWPNPWLQLLTSLCR